MRGIIKMSFEPCKDGMHTISSVTTKLQNVSISDKFAAVHKLICCLNFDNADLALLSMAIATDCWPDKTESYTRIDCSGLRKGDMSDGLR